VTSVSLVAIIACITNLMVMSKVATLAMDTVRYTKSQWIQATTATIIIAE
jgi:hypothetical protein